MILRYFLSDSFILIHGLIRTPDRILYRLVGLRIVHRNTQGDMDLVPFILRQSTEFLPPTVEGLDQSLHAPEVLILQNHGEFITAETEHRTVTENMTDQTAGSLQVDISLVMPVHIIYLLQVIAIQHTDGEIKIARFIQTLLKILYIFIKY